MKRALRESVPPALKPFLDAVAEILVRQVLREPVDNPSTPRARRARGKKQDQVTRPPC